MAIWSQIIGQAWNYLPCKETGNFPCLNSWDLCSYFLAQGPRRRTYWSWDKHTRPSVTDLTDRQPDFLTDSHQRLLIVTSIFGKRGQSHSTKSWAVSLNIVQGGKQKEERHVLFLSHLLGGSTQAWSC